MTTHPDDPHAALDAKWAEAYEAFAAMQSELPIVEKGNINPAFRGSFYADLADIVPVTLPVLTKHGFSIRQPLSGGGEKPYTLTTKLSYKNGVRFDEESVVLPIARDASAQAVGSALTYMRRYCYCTMLGIVSDRDDDGRAASGRPPAPAASDDPVTALRHALRETCAGIVDPKGRAEARRFVIDHFAAPDSIDDEAKLKEAIEVAAGWPATGEAWLRAKAEAEGGADDGDGSAEDPDAEVDRGATENRADEPDSASEGSAPPPATNREPEALRRLREAPAKGRAEAVKLAAGTPDYARETRTKRMHALFREVGVTDRDDRLTKQGEILGRSLVSSTELTDEEVEIVIAVLVVRKGMVPHFGNDEQAF